MKGLEWDEHLGQIAYHQEHHIISNCIREVDSLYNQTRINWLSFDYFHIHFNIMNGEVKQLKKSVVTMATSYCFHFQREA